jgi:hypothetical protein
MESDAKWIAARRVSGGDWHDVHVAPVEREMSKEIVEQLRNSETPDLLPSQLQWSEGADGSLAAQDVSYEYRIASTDMWAQGNS